MVALVSSLALGLGAAGCAGQSPSPSVKASPSREAGVASGQPPARADHSSVARSPTALVTPVPPTATPTPAPRTLTLWTVRSDPPWLQALHKAVTTLPVAPGVVAVEVSGAHADFGEIVESFGAGLAPDLIEPGDFVPLAARSMLRPLDRFLASSAFDARNYPPAMWVNGQWQQKVFAIPALDHGPELGLVWNSALTATASTPASWEDLYVFGRQLTQRDAHGAIQLLGFDPLDGVGGLLDTVRDVTGQQWYDPAANRVTLDHPAFRAFLDGIAAYYQAVGIEQLRAFRKAWRPLTDSKRSAVNAGRQVAILNGYWSPPELDRLASDHSWRFEVGWIPSIPLGTTIQRLGGRVLAIPVAAKEPDDAWALIETLSSDAANRILCEGVGTFALTRSFAQSGGWKTHPGVQFYVDSVTGASRLSSRSNNPVAGFAQAKWTQAIGQVLSGKQSSAEALKAAQTAVQAEADRIRSVSGARTG